jgi:hypothetical protein
MRMAEYLGTDVSCILRSHPFKDWCFERSVERNLDEPRVYYVFKQRGLDIECDYNDVVSTIFIRREECDGFTLSEIPFSLVRREVLECLGVPSKSGGMITDPISGPQGGWDRFAHADFTIHIEYTNDTSGIKMITLMLNDVVP